LSGCPSLTDSDVNKYAIINSIFKLSEKNNCAIKAKGGSALAFFY
jgi:hypothetical protein